MKIAILGGGSWGTALASLLAGRGEDVVIWTIETDVVEGINANHENPRYMKGYPLPHRVVATGDLAAALEGAGAVVVVIPSHAIREVLAEAADLIPTGVPIVAASKGIENDTLMTVAEVLEDVLPERHHPYLAFLSGPSFAREVIEKHPTAVTIAAYWPKVAVHAQTIFNTPYFRTYTSNDVIGVELGGALKNVIAIGAGIADGLGLGHNTRAALITRGLAEMSRLGVAKGANPLTFAGLAGMGDLLLTCTGDLSRNRTVGLELGRGRKLDQILSDLGMVAEGVKTARSAHDLGVKLKVELPITDAVYSVIYEGKDPGRAVQELMTRELKAELQHY